MLCCCFLDWLQINTTKKVFFWQFSQSVSFNCLEKRSSNDLSPENNYYFKHSLRARGNIVIVFSVNFCRSYKSLLKFRVLDFVMPYEVERSSFWSSFYAIRIFWAIFNWVFLQCFSDLLQFQFEILSVIFCEPFCSGMSF